MIKRVGTFIVGVVNKAASRVVSNLERQASEQNTHARDLKDTQIKGGVSVSLVRRVYFARSLE